MMQRKDGWFTDAIAQDLSESICRRLKGKWGIQEGPPTLRLSGLGPRCPKALWSSIHTPQYADPLPPWAEFKYSFGHTIEAKAIALAKAAGHKVEGEQDVLVVDGVTGHRDCVLDGHVVDVKSSSSFGMAKFKNGSIVENDSFGYLDQLDSYLVGSYGDPLVQVRDRGFILAIDLTLGHMVLYEHLVREEHIRGRIRYCKAIIERSHPPACECKTVPFGKSGNLKLDTKASYSPFRHVCYPDLRTFLYSDGPVYLTKVVRKPDVTEIDRYGNYVQSKV